EHASLSSRWHAIPPAYHPDVHWMVLLGISGESTRRHRVSLSISSRSCWETCCRFAILQKMDRFLRAYAQTLVCYPSYHFTVRHFVLSINIFAFNSHLNSFACDQCRTYVFNCSS